jgi:hypothetical protein
VNNQFRITWKEVVVAQFEVKFSGGTEEKHDSLVSWPRFEPVMSQIKTKIVMLKQICPEDQHEQ